MKRFIFFIFLLLLFPLHIEADGLLSNPQVNMEQDIYISILHSTMSFVPKTNSYMGILGEWELQNQKKLEKIYLNPSKFFNFQVIPSQNSLPEKALEETFEQIAKSQKRFFIRFRRIQNALNSNWFFCSYILSGKMDLSLLTRNQMDEIERILSARANPNKIHWNMFMENGKWVFHILVDEEIFIKVMPAEREMHILPRQK